MSDFLIEQLVKKRTTAKDMLIKGALIFATVVLFVFSGMVPFGIVLVLAMIAVDVFLFRRLNVEYEYTYFSGDLDIDIIYNMQSRKKKFSTSVKEIEIVAPTGSPQLRPFQELKVLNYSSMNPENKTYEMITSYKEGRVRVIFEPNEKILKGMQLLAPRKVVF